MTAFIHKTYTYRNDSTLHTSFIFYIIKYLKNNNFEFDIYQFKNVLLPKNRAGPISRVISRLCLHYRKGVSVCNLSI